MIINFFGGPGSTKSTIAPRVFSEMRALGYSAEIVLEYIKDWAYQGRPCQSFDQLFIFANQLHKVDFYLQHGVKHVVCDSPVFMQCHYTKKYSPHIYDEVYNLAQKFVAKYPDQLNIFLDREGIHYENKGRYETYEEALEMDKQMLQFFRENMDITVLRAKDSQRIVNFVLEKLCK